MSAGSADCPGRARARLRQLEHDADDQPDDGEHGEDPEQKSGLPDRQPRQLSLREEEAGPPYSSASRVELERLPFDCRRGVVRHMAVMIDVARRAAFRSRLPACPWHGASVPAARFPNTRHTRLSTGGEVPWHEA